MDTDLEALRERLESFADDELLKRLETGGLTVAASQLARAILRSRGIVVADFPRRPSAPPAEDYQGDQVLIARNLDPVEAHLICNTLRAGGVPAETGDVNLVQTNALLSIAVGGACVRVPEAFVEPARELLAAYRRGALALDEDYDVGAPQD